tara:strand:+ start:4361 stop:5368 length:1008 start_codon:yes stop_codon:yes gene_type:complete
MNEKSILDIIKNSDLAKFLSKKNKPNSKNKNNKNKSNKETLLELANEMKGKIFLWNLMQPNTDTSFSDLIKSIESGELNLTKIDARDWEAHKQKAFGDEEKNIENIRGYNEGRKNIFVPSDADPKTIKHEILHAVSGHHAKDDPRSPGEGYGTATAGSFLEQYLRKDRELGGWLPSVLPITPKPTLPGDSRFANWYNKNFASEYLEEDIADNYGAMVGRDAYNWVTGSRGKGDGNYQPKHYPPMVESEWAADALQEALEAAGQPNLSREEPPAKSTPVVSELETESPLYFDKNNYPVYDRKSKKAQSFRDAFRQARIDGEKVFTWDNRLYSADLK